MSFIESLLSGKYPQLENLWRKELGKVIDEAFTMLTTLGEFDEIDEHEPAAATVSGSVSLETYDRVTDMLNEERNRHEATQRELDLVRKEKATLEYKLAAAKHELST